MTTYLTRLLSDLGYVMANTEVIHNNAYERLLEVLGLQDVFEENLKLDFIEGSVLSTSAKYNHRFLQRFKKTIRLCFNPLHSFCRECVSCFLSSIS